MGLPKPQAVWTVGEYLDFERSATERHEYLDGELRVVPSESLSHGRISVNLVALVATQLLGTSCDAFTKTLKVRNGPPPTRRASRAANCIGLFSYPDLVVICGVPEYHDDEQDVILNPAAIAEVLSTSTEAFDRGEKFLRYQTWNPSLREYLLVSQDQPQIEHFSRQKAGWSYQLYTGLKSKVFVPTIDCTLKLADVFDRVKFAKKTS